MIFREWTKDDLLTISGLEKECFSNPWTLQMFVNAFESEYFYSVLAEENGEIIGYACETILFETAEVDNIAVHPKFRKKGVGKMLMQKLIDESNKRSADYSVLEVRVSNSSAMKLYLSLGYVGTYARKKYYPDGEDALIMRKELKNGLDL